jgi:hypothetical protein
MVDSDSTAELDYFVLEQGCSLIESCCVVVVSRRSRAVSRSEAVIALFIAPFT